MSVTFSTIFCCLCILVHCGDILRINSKSQTSLSLVEAVNKVFTKAFVHHVTITNLILPDSSDGFSIRDFVNDLVHTISLKGKTRICIFTSSKIPLSSERKKRSIVFIANSFETFLDIYENVKSHSFKFNGRYLMVLTDGEIPQVNEIFNLFWRKHIYNVNIIFRTINDSTVIKSFNPFIHKKCNIPSTIIINEFKNGSFLKPETEDFFPNKMQNLHQCPITVAIADNRQPFVFAKFKKKSSMSELSGRDIKLIKLLAEQLNFKINYTFIGPDQYFFENGTADGPLKALLDGVADMSISDFFLKSNRVKFFDASTVYVTQSLVFVIPQGKQLAPLEKIFYPFSTELWVMIAICFLIGFFVIFVVNCLSKSSQNVVFGEGVNYPYLNMFNGFIGGSQNVLPKKNFARFLLMLLLISSLVVRTIYQASYFQLIQKNKHHKKVQSVNEMIRKDFKFYVHPSMVDMFEGNEAMKNR